jgi:protein Mpv17
MTIINCINTFLKQRPLLVSLVGNTVKTAIADGVTQMVIEEKGEIDRKRLLLFTAFGFGYLGGWQYYLFNKLFVKCEIAMLKLNYTRNVRACTLTFLDLAVHTPLMYFPAFYAFKGCVEGASFEQSVLNYKNNFRDDVLSLWKVWLPAQMFNFSCLPIHLRMPFITSVSFAWTIILSMHRGS